MIDQTTLPARIGERPRTTNHAPHSQIDQLVDVPTRTQYSSRLIDTLSSLPHVSTGYSRRAPPGSVGLYMARQHACTDEHCFLLDNEFAHVHNLDDGSLHAILPEPIRTLAINQGWAEPHPFAGQPTVSPFTILIYAPRNEAELSIITNLIKVSWQNAQVTPPQTAL